LHAAALGLRFAGRMRHVLFAAIAFVAGIPLAALAYAVLPTSRVISRPALIVIGLAAGTVGIVAAIPDAGLFGPIAAAAAALLFVFLYGRYRRE
jgi:hydrogenase-4 membrane subunit HyfE